MSLFSTPKCLLWILAVVFLLSAGCFNSHSTPQLNLEYLDAVRGISVIRPYEYFDYIAVEKEIDKPEEVESLTEAIKVASVKGIYKPGDSRFPDIGFPDYYVDFKLGELEVRSFYWKERYILMPISLEGDQTAERYLLELERDFLE